jgi:cell division control protein 7
LLISRYPFFQSSDDCDAIIEISCLFGSRAISQAAAKCDRIWSCNVPSVPEEHVGWENVIRSLCPEMFNLGIPRECIDLLERCLCLDPDERITAEQALNHPFIKKPK